MVSAILSSNSGYQSLAQEERKGELDLRTREECNLPSGIILECDASNSGKKTQRVCFDLRAYSILANKIFT